MPRTEDPSKTKIPLENEDLENENLLDIFEAKDRWNNASVDHVQIVSNWSHGKLNYLAKIPIEARDACFRKIPLSLGWVTIIGKNMSTKQKESIRPPRNLANE